MRKQNEVTTICAEIGFVFYKRAQRVASTMCETVETGKTHETFEKVIVAIIVTVATTEIVGQSDSIRI